MCSHAFVFKFIIQSLCLIYNWTVVCDLNSRVLFLFFILLNDSQFLFMSYGTNAWSTFNYRVTKNKATVQESGTASALKLWKLIGTRIMITQTLNIAVFYYYVINQNDYCFNFYRWSRRRSSISDVRFYFLFYLMFLF